ncbi:MAG: radical SAM protein [Bryobacterales bacterium]|nr:radical SAM protein [Bryobacterales bacterium]
MANISITAACNRDCHYCFAVRQPDAGMSLELFERALDFLERSGIDQARVLGGEPTLHPQFPLFVDRVLGRGLRLLVFTNGLMPEAALRRLEEAPAETTAVLLNITPPEGHGPVLEPRQAETLRRLGRRASLGLNFHSPAIAPRFLLDLIGEYGLSRSVRLGLAHPKATGSNRYLHPRQYRAVGERLVEFAAEARKAGVAIAWDCGFVPCMFPPGSLEALGEDAEGLGVRCSPIPDVLADGDVVSCYPLAGLYRERLSSYDAGSLRQAFSARFSSLRPLSIFRECANCAVRREGGCVGGCLAASMQRLRAGDHGAVTIAARREARERTSVDRDATAGARQRWVIPYVDQPLSFWEQIHEEFGADIGEVYFPLPAGLIGSGEPPQPDAHLVEFLKSAPLGRSVLVNPITLPQPVDFVAPRVIEALRRLVGEHGISSATVSNLQLAARIREKLPGLPLTASVLMDITRPNQALMLRGICDGLVPSSRIMRDLDALGTLRAAFPGRIRLIVNEACLPGCPYRVQHFHEMCAGVAFPLSLCRELLEREPWMRLTGAWVLPQHLHYFDGLYDELKLGGRVTLRHAGTYRRVLQAYVRRLPLSPHEIGGGPASVVQPLDIEEKFYARTLRCGLRCHECRLCRSYYDAAGKKEDKLARIAGVP